ncbi:MAG TPA: 1-deoxy-D-xylulose-5-phosphate synthase [Oscillospiraceae bacterium]|nr:1-deoxy-D-xylulose-5-phosphate synthase [Oscillospiraceae bacterium]
MSENNFLDSISCPKDLKALDEKELKLLAEEIRQRLITTVTQTGGHLSSNLGLVELTIALHRVFKSPYDHILWDVGHQCYTHKLLTGRCGEFDSLRCKGGISGYPFPCESEHDFFHTGHSGTAVSSALGIARAKNIKRDNTFVIAVVGDGSFTNGLVYEALNNAGRSNSRLIVILNENEMSISKNVGAMARYLTAIRTKPRYYKFKAKTENVLNKIPLVGRHLAGAISRIKMTLKNAIYKTTWFDELGFNYIGPIDGHNIEQLTQALNSAKFIQKPVLLHVKTVKGKGYDLAEQSPTEFHGVSAFDLNSGDPITKGTNYSAEMGKFLCEMARKDKRICAVTAAMSVGTGLEEFGKEFPERFFDVGIAESHAVTFSGGMAKFNMIPVFAVYSSFLQRTYDQILHDLALQDLKVVLAVDRAGFVGEDGETHQGIYDVAFLNTIPDICVYAPSSYTELRRDLHKGLYFEKTTTAVRYPRGNELALPGDFVSENGSFDTYPSRYADTLPENVIVTYGRIFSYACQALAMLESEGYDNFAIIKINRIKPIDPLIADKILGAKNIFFFEEGVTSGSVGEKLAAKLLQAGFIGSYRLFAIGDCFVPQATVDQQLEDFGLDAKGIFNSIVGSFTDKNEEKA